MTPIHQQTIFTFDNSTTPRPPPPRPFCVLLPLSTSFTLRKETFIFYVVRFCQTILYASRFSGKYCLIFFFFPLHIFLFSFISFFVPYEKNTFKYYRKKRRSYNTLCIWRTRKYLMCVLCTLFCWYLVIFFFASKRKLLACKNCFWTKSLVFRQKKEEKPFY